MPELRTAGQYVNTLQSKSVTVGGVTKAATAPTFKQPQVVTEIPLITGIQQAGNVVGVDTGDLVGPFTYQWRSSATGDIGSAATQALPNPGMADVQVTCDVTHAGGVTSSLPITVYSLMGGDADAAEAAALALCPHEDATHVAIVDGQWSNPATWLGGDVPADGARVLIPHGINVTYDRNKARLRLDWLRVDGTLTADPSLTTRMLFETMLVPRSGTLSDGSLLNPVQANRVHEWIVSGRDYRTSNGFEDTDIDIARDPTLVGRGIIIHGKREMFGAICDTAVRTEPGGAPMQGDTSCVLASVPVGWKPGDTIVIGGTSPTVQSESEERVITAISGALVSWADPLVHNHDHQYPLVTRDDLQPAVMNITRNIVIRSERDDLEPWRQGHTMDTRMHAEVSVYFVEGRDLGRTRKGPDVVTGQIDANGDFERPSGNGSTLTTEPLTAQSNIKGRYAFHAHSFKFDQPVTATYYGCIARGVVGFGMVHHDGRAKMNNCGVYDFAGTGIVSETGNELGEWFDCYTIKSRVKRGDTPKEASLGGDVQGDFGRLGYGMFVRSRGLHVVGCMCMDVSWGFVGFHRTRANATIVGLTKHLRKDLDIKDLQGAYGGDEVAVPDHPFIHIANNEFAGCYGGGLFISKDGVEQNHGVSSNLRDLKAWSCRDRGLMVEYINQYVLTNPDIVAANPSFGGLRRGIEVGSQTFQVSIVNPKTERATQGIYFDGGSVDALPAFDAVTNPRYMIAGHTSIDDTDAWVDNSAAKGNAEFLRIWPTAPTPVEPTVTLPFVVADWNGSTGFNQGISNAVASGAGGTLSDTVSASAPIPNLTDALGLPINDPFSGNRAQYIRARAQEDGYWMYNGEPHVIFPLYLSDRLYGTVIKSIHAVRMTGSTGGYTNNGTYTVSANAPVSGDFSNIAAPRGQTTIVDVVGGSSDPDGGTLTLSPSFFKPDRGEFVINGGTVEFTPYDSAPGTYTGTAFLADGQGNETRTEIVFGVT